MLYCNQKVYHIILNQNHKKYLGLRNEFPFFEFQSYSFLIKNQVLEVEYAFCISGIYNFRPSIRVLPRGFYRWEELKKSAIENLVFQIGMIELISYWKTTCSPILRVKPHKLDDAQVDWWIKLYFHGLGEFFYLNGIETSMDGFMEIQSEGPALTCLDCTLSNEEIIVPVGGGKDSVVSLEVLKKNDMDIIPMSLNPREAIKRTIESSGYSMDGSIVVERKIDPLLFDLNKKDYLNGHTPFSALLAFINVLVAVGSGTKLIALSNESSANQSTIPGTKINHQYSKSIEFETDFNWYVKKYIHPEINYFSFLRPLNELQIARLFSGFTWHLSGFRSCNVASKTDEWCGECPKCLFTDIMLAPFLKEKQRFDIFQKNLLDDARLEPIFDELTGKASIKPFECVGTPDEVKAALFAFANKLNEKQYPVLLKKFMIDHQLINWNDDYKRLLKQFDKDHFIPLFLEQFLKSEINPLENGFKAFLQNELTGFQHIVILGFGREGRSTYSLLRAYFPEMQLAIADQSEKIKDDALLKNDTKTKVYCGKKYLSSIMKQDMVIKSPGVKLSADSINSSCRISSQTELFLSYYRDQVIGVTGTKGKSTTVSLIHHFLQKAGRKSVLLGNIGTPAFNHIKHIDEDTVIVFELSAHQLQNIQVSPHIAVLLNIFPEHLDHFDSIEEYKKAKVNIARYQHTGDKLFVTRLIEEHTDEFGADRIIINETDLAELKNVSTALKGTHNFININSALKAVEAIGVSKESALTTVSDFNPLSHRLEFVGEYRGILFYNDSISTIPESTIAAVKTIPNIKTLILGGFFRGLDYREMVDYLSSTEINTFLFLGIAGEKMFDIFKENPCPGQQYIKVESLEDALPFIKKNTPVGSACLLSPAAASYDQFHNFEHRGNIFKELARSI